MTKELSEEEMSQIMSKIELKYLELVCNRLEEQNYYGLNEIIIIMGNVL